jgi:hypothetical protein
LLKSACAFALRCFSGSEMQMLTDIASDLGGGWVDNNWSRHSDEVAGVALHFNRSTPQS